MIAITKVKPLEDYKLLLQFSNSEQKIFDMSAHLDHGIFIELKDKKNFNTVKIAFDSIEWVNGADLCPDLLYEKSNKLDETQLES